MKRVLFFILNKIIKSQNVDNEFIWTDDLRIEFADTCEYWKDLPISLKQAIGMFKIHIELMRK